MEARDGNPRGALRCYSEALELNPPRGQHLLYANRSGVKLALGDAAGAVQDGQKAVEQAPAGFTTAFIRLVRLASCLQAVLPCSAGGGTQLAAVPHFIF